tara:strand:- start:20669 stop:21355 length:687 start_codon:yes stop_codon:yes gene_type:complete
MKHITLQRNEAGRDLVLADVNGCINELNKLVDEVEFSPSDRLFLLGNSINKGLYSYDVVDFVTMPNVYSLIGHAEVLMLTAMLKGLPTTDREIFESQWDDNGGLWRHDLHADTLKWMNDQISNWPLSITIESDRRYGLVHSEPTVDDWGKFISTEPDYRTLMGATLGQTILQGDRDGLIDNVDVVVAGHTQLARPPVWKGKCAYLNHGIVIGKKAKIYTLDELKFPSE